MSITITLNSQQLEEARTLAKAIHASKKWGWDWENVLIGVLGETAYSIYTNQPVNTAIYESVGDGGTDFEDGAQVKTVTWPGPSKEVKVSGHRAKLNQAPTKYVLAHVNRNDYSTIILIGEISIESFDQKKTIKDYKGKPVQIVTEYQLDKIYE